MASDPLISIGLPISLFFIMIGIGMTLTAREFHQVTVKPAGLVIGTLAQIVLMPVFAFGLVWALALPPAIAVGLVIIAACPGGTTSNVFTLLARGNVALSIVLTVSASMITILSLPFFTNIALSTYFGTEEAFTLPFKKTVTMLALIVLLPVAIGMILRAFWPQLADRAERPVSLFGLLVLTVLVVTTVYGIRERIVGMMLEAGPAAIALNLIGIGFGLLSGKWAGLSSRESLAIATELGIKNGTLGLMVTLTLLHSNEMSIPSVIYSVVMFPIGFLLVSYGRRVIAANKQSPRTSDTAVEKSVA